MPAQSLLFQLDTCEMISPQVKHFRLRGNFDGSFHFQPGQFITIHFEHEGKSIHRSYSIANAPNNNNAIEFAANYVVNGPGTEFLYNLAPGDTVQITGPFGRLTLKDKDPKRYIFIATSTGVTPYRSMLNELSSRLNADPELQVLILQGVRTHEDVLYSQDFLAFAAQHHRFSFQAYLSRETSDALHPHEQKGYVQHALPSLQLNSKNDLVYLCGNPAMIDAAFDYLKQQGFEVQHIIREKYISR